MCPTTGIAYDDPEPNSFSFNSPKGSCNTCKGLGVQMIVDENKIFPNLNLSIEKGGIAPIMDRKSIWINKQLKIISKRSENARRSSKTMKKDRCKILIFNSQLLNLLFWKTQLEKLKKRKI